MKVTYATLWEAEETLVFAERQTVFLPLIQTTPIHSFIVAFLDILRIKAF